VHLLQSRTDEAIVWLERARNVAPAHPNCRALLASAYGLKGATERASSEFAELRRLSINDRLFSLARWRRADWVPPSVRALFEATYIAGLRKAGMPEE